MRRVLILLPLVVVVAGTVAGAAIGGKAGLSLDPRSVKFGDVTVNPDPTPIRSIMITNNTGTTVFYVENTEPKSGAFTINTFDCYTLAADASCTFTIRFGPTVTGHDGGALTLTYNDTSNNLYKASLRVSGTGV